jgi:hypothetical protein
MQTHSWAISSLKIFPRPSLCNHLYGFCCTKTEVQLKVETLIWAAFKP